MAKKVITISLPGSLQRAVDAAARRDNRSRSSFIGKTLSDSLKGNMKSLSDRKEGTRPDYRLSSNGPTRKDDLPRSMATEKAGTELDHTLSTYGKREKEL